MSTNDTRDRESIEPRTERALTESMVVLPEVGDIYTVVGENGGGEYRVDAREGRCTCPDHQHRDARCKHLRRVAFATGERPIPAIDGVDELLGEHTDSTPRAVATDGGVIDAGDDGEILDESDESARPGACTCHPAWNADAPPCWPCYRRGFREPNPDAPGDDYPRSFS